MSNSDTHRDVHELFNDRDFDGIVKRLSSSFRYEDRPRNRTITSTGEFTAWLHEWVDSLEGRCTDARYLDAGDTSVALFTGRGTNNGPMGPFPATGRSVEFAICELLTYDADGNITGGEIYYDRATILGQLGHLQLPA